MFIDVNALIAENAPHVAAPTMLAIMEVESGFNPFAIGVVGGRLHRQPANLAEALATARELERQGYDFSVGLCQVNVRNLRKMNVPLVDAFDPATNVRLGSSILVNFYNTAYKSSDTPQVALTKALSAYYSGSFSRGLSYARRIYFASKGVKQGRRQEKILTAHVSTLFSEPSKSMSPQRSTIVFQEDP